MTNEDSLLNRRSLLSGGKSNKYGNRVFDDFNMFSQLYSKTAIPSKVSGGSSSTTPSTSPPTPVGYSVGDTALGGVIGYILQNGDHGYDPNVQHGLVATTSLTLYSVWGCNTTLINGITSTEIGMGNQNTINIVAECNDVECAAKKCSDLTEGGYSDWYLPSRDELQKLALNKVAIGNFVSDDYWSSSQSNATEAYWVRFSNTNLGLSQGGVKTYNLIIRPVRSF